MKRPKFLKTLLGSFGGVFTIPVIGFSFEKEQETQLWVKHAIKSYMQTGHFNWLNEFRKVAGLTNEKKFTIICRSIIKEDLDKQLENYIFTHTHLHGGKKLVQASNDWLFDLLTRVRKGDYVLYTEDSFMARGILRTSNPENLADVYGTLLEVVKKLEINKFDRNLIEWQTTQLYNAYTRTITERVFKGKIKYGDTPSNNKYCKLIEDVVLERIKREFEGAKFAAHDNPAWKERAKLWEGLVKEYKVTV